MRIIILGLFFLGVSYNTFSQTITYPSQDSLEAWRSHFNTPAVAIGIIDDGKLKSISSVGELGEGRPAPVDAIFNVASLAKAVTTYTIMQLVESGDWDLREPLSNYWVDPDVEGHPFTGMLTAHHVLTHTTGFPNWRYMADSGKLTFNFEPGTKFGYSGEGFEYLRKALESKFDKNLEELADSIIFKPYHMTDSFWIQGGEVDSSRIAVPHDSEGNAYEISLRDFPNAADDLFTTVSDLGTFGTMVMDSTKLSPELFDLLTSPASQARPGVHFSYGWVLFEGLPNGEYALFNAGSDKGVNALIVLLPNSGRGMAAFTNGDSGRPLVMKLISEILGETGTQILSRF